MNFFGISFQPPNDDQFNICIASILAEVKMEKFIWEITNIGIHKIVNGEIMNEFLFNDVFLMEGEKLKEVFLKNDYYPIQLTLLGLPLGNSDKNYSINITNKEFLKSPFEIVFDIVDYNYLQVLCKDKKVLEKMFVNVKKLGYENIEFIKE